jgi:hypothetical protein
LQVRIVMRRLHVNNGRGDPEFSIVIRIGAFPADSLWLAGAEGLGGPSAYQAILGARNRRMRSVPRRAETKIVEIKRRIR